MLTLLAATPNWWDMPGYSCLRQVTMDTSKDIDLDVLQAAINLNHRDKFIRDRTSRRVAMKRLYQRHPVSTLCQEGVSKCSDMMGATFILFLILYRICSKQSRAQAARIKIHNRAAVVRAVKADYPQNKGGTMAKPYRHKIECRTVTSDKAKAVDCTSKDHTVDRSNHEASYSSKVIAATTSILAVGVFDVRGYVRYLQAIIRQRLLLSGDVELNPGPLDDIEQILSAVDATTFSEDDWNIVMRECHSDSLSAKWQQLCGYLGLPIGLIDSIQKNYPNDTSACWSEALKRWIQQKYNTVKFGLPSWRTLLEAIARENRLLFKTLADDHQASATSGTNIGKTKLKEVISTNLEKMKTDDKEVSPSKERKKKRKRKRKKVHDEDEHCPKQRRIRLGPEAEHFEDAAVQQIIVPVHGTVGGENPSKLPTLTFQCVNVEGMNEEDKKQFYQTLYTESVEMMFKFQELFTSTRVSLNNRKISSHDVYSHVQCLGQLTPVFEGSGLPEFQQQIPKLQQAQTVDDAMSIINGYCSFFNFRILELIIEKLGSPEDTANLSKYKEEFNEYAKRHVFQCPSEVGTVTSGDAKMFVTLDKTFNKCSLNALHLFCSSLREILNLSPGSGLKLCQIEPGSLKLTFQLPFSLLQGTFPLTEEQESAMARLGVENLWLIYTFNKQHIQKEEEEETTGIGPDKILETDEESADSVSEKDEATDSLDKREDAVAAGIDLVSKNVIKLDDASSSADSALATSIATFTRVSRYSEDMGPRDVPYLRKEDDTAKPHSVGDTSGLELHQASYRLGETEKVEQWMEETQAAEGMSGVSLIGAIDQGTGSSRLQVFNENFDLVSWHPEPIEPISTEEGWFEQDGEEYVSSVKKCLDKVAEDLATKEYQTHQLRGIGITNQRETTVLWDKRKGKTVHPALVWSDGRTAGVVKELIEATPTKSLDHLRPLCGLPISTYFSAVKIKWVMDTYPDIRKAMKEGNCLFGTVDTWLIWNLTGGVDGGVHVTDVTNASRTMLMNIHTQQWDPKLCEFFDIPMNILPEIRSCSEVYGHIADGPFKGIPICGCIGDQQAALVGQQCFNPGDAKNTYGAGCFLLCNTGQQPVMSQHGLLTTVAYQLGPHKPVTFALEGSVSIGGQSVYWLRDNLEFFKEPETVETWARKVDDTGGVYFVPAFSGLLAPHWEPDARGLIMGLTNLTTKAHLCRATLEAVCFQSKEILDAMKLDYEFPMAINSVRVDGGMTENELMLQLQANILEIKIAAVRPNFTEMVTLGAAIAAGLAVNVWKDISKLPAINFTFKEPKKADEYDEKYRQWKEAVDHCLQWAEDHKHKEKKTAKSFLPSVSD